MKLFLHYAYKKFMEKYYIIAFVMAVFVTVIIVRSFFFNRELGAASGALKLIFLLSGSMCLLFCLFTFLLNFDNEVTIEKLNKCFVSALAMLILNLVLLIIMTIQAKLIYKKSEKNVKRWKDAK